MYLLLTLFPKESKDALRTVHDAIQEKLAKRAALREEKVAKCPLPVHVLGF